VGRELQRIETEDELRAALATREELGAEFEPQIVESFLARVEREIDERVDMRLAEYAEAEGGDSRDASDVAIWSLGLGIPLTGAAGGTGGVAAIIFVWIGIVFVNFAYALSRLRSR
jgi:hypothetical protein